MFDGQAGLHQNDARDFDPAIEKYMEGDPVGLIGGSNVYAYVDGNPISESDPLGLWRFGDPLPQGIVDFSAGWGASVSFGLTNQVNRLLGSADVVDQCSRAYAGGEAFGFLNNLAIGWTGGLKSAAGKFPQFSHSLFPDRYLRAFDNGFAGWLNQTGNRLNGDYLPTVVHALIDPANYRFAPALWKEMNPMFPMWRRALNGIPYLPGSAAYGAGSATISSCGCK